MPVLVVNHLLLALGLVLSFIEPLCLALCDLELLDQTFLFLLVAHEANMQIILFLSLLIQNVLLLIESLLKPCLIFLEATSTNHRISRRVLLLHQRLVLKQSLLEDAS